jgi:hypothetical protein
MKKQLSLLLLLAASFFFSSLSYAGSPFEGSIKYSMQLNGANSAEIAALLPREMKLTIKGNRLRTELTGGLIESIMGVIVSNPEKGLNCILNSNVKMAYTLEVESESQDAPVKAEPTGKKERIAGYSCEEYLIVLANGEKSTVWITKEIQLPKVSEVKQAPLTRFLNNIPGGNWMPMRITQKIGDSELTLEVMNVKKEKVSDSLFEIPEGYQTAPFNPSMFGGDQGDE